MAYGLIYNLNFASNLEGNRKHRLSIYKEGHTATITTSDNNIIGTEEPVRLIWDSTDDIYGNIMGSRLEINLLSDEVKNININDILEATTADEFQVRFYIENGSGTLVEYWRGYINNATFQQRISSVPVRYTLIATDLLTMLGSLSIADNAEVIKPRSSVIKHLNSMLNLLPNNSGIKISNDFQLRPYKPLITNSFTELEDLQWLFPYGSSFQLISETVDGYLSNVLKAFNARVFQSDNYWYITNNSSYGDTPSFQEYSTSGSLVGTTTPSVVKTIPTDFKPVGNDLSVVYETPIDAVEVVMNRNNYTTDFIGVGLIRTDDFVNLTPYSNFETKPSILVNAYYSDNFDYIKTSRVKSGNYSVKTTEMLASGTPTDKIFDTGFVGDFQYENDPLGEDFYFFTSFFIENTGSDNNDTTIYYSIVKEVSASQSGTSPSYYYSTGVAWLSYTLESQIAKLPFNKADAQENTWVDIKETISGQANSSYVRYRIIMWEPVIDTATIGGVTKIHFDEVFLGRYSVKNYHEPIRTLHAISGSTRKNKKLKYEFDFFYPVVEFTDVKSAAITPSYTLGQSKLNYLIAQQILNDNRAHINRYSCSVVAQDFDDILYPYHKIDIQFNDFATVSAGIIDRLTYNAKSGVYNVEFHEPNQSSNVTISTIQLGDVT
jgi:hypothetical protein